MLAPNQVSAPAATQTRSMPPNDGTARLTSDGCTKIDEPTMVPTTIAVAWVSPMLRRRGRESFPVFNMGSGIISAIQRVVAASAATAIGRGTREKRFPTLVENSRRGETIPDPCGRESYHR